MPPSVNCKTQILIVTLTLKLEICLERRQQI